MKASWGAGVGGVRLPGDAHARASVRGFGQQRFARHTARMCTDDGSDGVHGGRCRKHGVEFMPVSVCSATELPAVF
eukprot:358413-Chlamydomonas_euryale.AAC.9